MRFLIDACLPREITGLLHSYGHVPVDVRDVGMRHAKDRVIAAYAKANGLCILTEDWGFADIRVYPPADYHGIVVLETTDAGEAEKLRVTRLLLDDQAAIGHLPGRLAIVSASRIRLRPPP